MKRTHLVVAVALLLLLFSIAAYPLTPQAKAFVGTTHTSYFSACINESTARIVWEAHKQNGIASARIMFETHDDCGTIYATATVVRVLDEAVLDFMGDTYKMFLSELEAADGTRFYSAAAAGQLTGA